MREIPKKNYLILFILLAATAGIVFFACDIYESRTKKQYSSVMNSFLTEVKLDDLSGYTLENSTVVIFVSDKFDSSLEDIETKYKKILTENNIQHLFVYLDVSDESVLASFNEMYNLDLTTNTLPILVVIDEGKVINSYINLDFDEQKIGDFLEENEVIEND